MRSYVPMLVLQVRVALAEGDFAKAAHHLETGFAFSRHVAAGPTLIHRLIAFALVSQFASAVADFTEQPGAPNLFWALTALPHPLIELQSALDWEYRMLEMIYPELEDLDRERTAAQWDGLLRRVRTGIRNLFLTGNPLQLPEWFPKQCDPDKPAAESPDLPAARKAVAHARNLSAEKVAAMPPAQVLILYLVDTLHEYRDELYRVSYLPYPQARPWLEAARKHLRHRPTSEGQLLPYGLLPALEAVIWAQARIERNLAALRVVEALRIYAAAHDGKLPDKLAEITEVPVPEDPGTGRPFEYRREGDTATVLSQVPGEPQSHTGIRYLVTIRKK
jgi:hypothetical protein